MRHRPTGRLPLLLIAGLAAVSCGGDDDEADPATPTDTTPDVTSSAASDETTADETSADDPSTDETSLEEVTGGTDPAMTSAAQPPGSTEPTDSREDVTTSSPPSTLTETTSPPATSGGGDIDEPAAFTPIGDGPFEVGVATVVLPDAERPLTADVWFPLRRDVDTAQLTAHRYTLIPSAYYESPAAFSATPDLLADDGPFPLVVYSHGSGGIRFIHSSMAEAIAGHGYVVVSADHTGNTVIERIAGSSAPREEIAIARPGDVRRIVDAFVDPANRTVGSYATTVDPNRVAVVGHSVGGYTAIVSVTGFTNAAGTVEPDDRIDAIVPIAPAISEVPSDQLLSEIDVPTLTIVGSDDVTTPPDPNVTRLWAALEDAEAARPAYRIELLAAEHQTFTEICAYQAAVPTLPGVPEIVVDTIEAFAVEGCSPGDMPAERATEITNTYVIGFLDEVFKNGDPIGPDTIAPPDDVAIESR